MESMGRILVADDDEMVRSSTVELLADAGFTCDSAPDANRAIALLQRNNYDLLISDIQMPGNPDLELIREIPQIKAGLPVIIITGYPSLKTAMDSIQLPVVAYMLKPIDWPKMLSEINRAIGRYRILTAVSEIKEKMGNWQAEIATVEECMKDAKADTTTQILSVFITIMFRCIEEEMMLLKNLVEPLAAEHASEETKQCLENTRPLVLVEALRETIAVLDKTKTAFKSKDLGDLRRKLELLVQYSSN